MENSFLIDNNSFLSFFQSQMIILDSFSQNPIHKIIFLSIQRQLIRLGKRHCHLSLNLQVFNFLWRNVPTSHDSFEICSFQRKSAFWRRVNIESFALQLFQLLMNASVAKQKSLRELYYAIKAIDKVFNLIQNILIIFYLCLLLDDTTMDLSVNS